MKRFLFSLLFCLFSFPALSAIYYQAPFLDYDWFTSESSACSALAGYLNATVVSSGGGVCRLQFQNGSQDAFTFSSTSCDGQISGSMKYGPVVCTPCSGNQVLNPDTGQCQAPCVITQPAPPFPTENMKPGWVGSEDGTTCESGCTKSWSSWAGEDTFGFDVWHVQSQDTGQMCNVGTLPAPPVAPPRSCSEPNVVRSDGTCGTPDPANCPAWQEVKDHQCQDKPCEAGKTLKCGTVNDAQQCACAGPTDCEPGTTKNAFGNCVTQQSCPSGQVQDSVTGVCGPPKDDQKDCPDGTHREGMTCVKNPGDCQVGTWYIPGCGCVSDVNQCMQRSSNDIDGDGIPNNTDNDADNDGLPNGIDHDDDNDGTPNSLDSTPQGPGSSPLADPSKTRDTSKSDPDGDLDGDGIPNSTDPDRDGDGLPNGDDGTPDGREDGTGVEDGQCDPATQECEGEKDKPGKPAELGDQFYKKKEDRSFQQTWSNFISRVQQARIVTAGSRFFTVSIGGGSCPNWVIPSTFVSSAIPITLQCSSEVTAALRIAGYIVLIIAAWVAFKIALL